MSEGLLENLKNKNIENSLEGEVKTVEATNISAGEEASPSIASADFLEPDASDDATNLALEQAAKMEAEFIDDEEEEPSVPEQQAEPVVRVVPKRAPMPVKAPAVEPPIEEEPGEEPVLENQAVKFSIIVPIYGMEDYIATALKSIKMQKYSEYEVIIVNNATKDAAAEIADEFIAADSRFSMIEIADTTVSTARNAGIEAATGDYIVFLDGDDCLSKDALAIYAAEIAVAEADMYIGLVEQFCVSGFRLMDAPKKIAAKAEPAMMDMDWCDVIMMSGKCYRLDYIKEKRILFGNFKYLEDGIFVRQVVYSGAVCRGINKVTYLYRKRAPLSKKAVTQRKDEAFWGDFIQGHVQILSMAEAVLKDYPDAKAYRNRLYEKIITSTIEHFYRNIWLLTSGSEYQVMETLKFYMSQVTEETRRRIADDNPDLILFPELGGKASYIEKPRFRITLANDISEDAARESLTTLYEQGCPGFIVIMPKRLESLGFKYENIEYVDETQEPAKTFEVDFNKTRELFLRAHAAGYSLDIYIDKTFLFSENLLKEIYKEAVKQEMNWVYIPITKRISEDPMLSPIKRVVLLNCRKVINKIKGIAHFGQISFRNHAEDYPAKEPEITWDESIIVR